MIWLLVVAIPVGLFFWAELRKNKTKQKTDKHQVSRRAQTRLQALSNRNFPPISETAKSQEAVIADEARTQLEIRRSDIERLSAGEINRLRVSEILNANRNLTGASSVSKADIEELTSVLIDVGPEKTDQLVINRNIPIPSPSAARASSSSPTTDYAQWIPENQAVEIAGVHINGGLIYVGSRLRNSAQHANCLINPSLSVASSGDMTLDSMGYWPSYGTIQPRERRAYLNWLATGRQNPNASVGYIFLYFYGLERRIFVDGAYEDRAVIKCEIERLLSIYQANGSFRGYATRFLDALSLLDWNDDTQPECSLGLREGYELPNSVKLHIGSKLGQKVPLTAADAFLWSVASPEVNFRTPAVRCFEEFKILWASEFNRQYPEGMLLREPKKRLHLSYRSATGFSVSILTDGQQIPDIAEMRAPLDKFQSITQHCTDALDPFSRFLGRNPGSEGTLAAARLLPPEIVATKGHPALTKITEQIVQLLDGQASGLVKADALAGIFDISTEDAAITRSLCVQMGAILENFDYAFEPDVRYGASSFASDNLVYLFKAKGGAKVDPVAAGYSFYRMMVEVAAVASASDERLMLAEFDVIKDTVVNAPELNQTEKTRLIGLAVSLWKNVPKQANILKRLSDLSAEQKRRVADTAIRAIMADGYIDPREVAFLERLYKSLGYAEGEVYSALHQGAASKNDVPLAPPKSEKVDKSQVDNSIRLDPSRLARIRGETDIVSQMLANIFSEEASDSIAAPSALQMTKIGKFKGLDAEHGKLLGDILLSGRVARSEFDAKARALKLLPDGAVETINDWAFDQLDEPVLDGDDVLTIPAHLVDQLRGYEIA